MADALQPEAAQGQSAQSSRPGGRRVSLGGALFDGLPADGHFIPADPVPGSWLDLYTEHADEDGSVHVGVYRSCRGGRDFTLREAGKARLTLHSKGAKDMAEWTRQLVGVRAALRTRASKPTSVGLTVHSQDYLAAVSEQLQGAGQGITELRVKDEQVDSVKYSDSIAAEIDQRMTQFLSTLHLLCPYITTLDLHTLPCLLPPPSNLPHLTKVHMRANKKFDVSAQTAQEVAGAVGRFLPQLTHLHYDSCTTITPWGALFTANNTTHTLTHFTTGAELGDELVSCLLQYTPALESLSVSGASVLSDEYSEREWGVSELWVKSGAPGSDVDLASLPVSRGGALRIHMDALALEAVGDQGLRSGVQERLPTWHFPDTKTVTILGPWTFQDEPVANHAALRSTLQQLTQHLQAPYNHLALTHWSWDAQHASAVSEAGDMLQGKTLSVHEGDMTMTDAMLGGLLGAHVRSVSVAGLGLQMDRSGVVWPWQTLRVDTLDLAQVLKLPTPSNEQPPRTLTAQSMTIPGTLSQADIVRLHQKLQRVRVSCSQVTVHYPTNTSPESLKAQLLPLTSIHIDTQSRYGQLHSQVSLLHWPLTRSALEALRHLPHWSTTLDLRRCTWPEDPHVYTQLASHVPSTYTTWLVGGLKPDSALVKAICVGLNRRRQGLGLKPVVLEVVCISGLLGKPTLTNVGDHVVLRRV